LGILRVLSVVASDRKRIGSRVYPQSRYRKRPALAALGLAALLAGCGGESSKREALVGQEITRAAFSVSFPQGWSVESAGKAVTAKQDGDNTMLASVTVLPLVKRYKPALFQKAIAELDRVTAALAAKLDGKVIARRTVIVARSRARQYDLAYTRAGAGLVNRITYVLRGKSEYYLLCRWPVEEGQPPACDLLTSSLRLR
jgi:hypothetical protein